MLESKEGLHPHFHAEELLNYMAAELQRVSASTAAKTDLPTNQEKKNKRLRSGMFVLSWTNPSPMS